LKVQNTGDPPESEDEAGAINDDQEKGSSSKKSDDDQSKNSSRPAGLTDADIEVLRGKFPILRELSSGFIKGLTPTKLMNLEKASMKRGQAERFKDAEDKLTRKRQAWDCQPRTSRLELMTGGLDFTTGGSSEGWDARRLHCGSLPGKGLSWKDTPPSQPTIWPVWA
jgi:hypothetical protein